MRDFLLIALGAALGANARYWLGGLFAARFGLDFPWGTLFINGTGGLLIGLLFTLFDGRIGGDPTARLVLGTGFLGAYTTFSTFSYDTVRLLQTGAYGAALFNVTASVGLSLAGTFAGLWLGRLLV